MARVGQACFSDEYLGTTRGRTLESAQGLFMSNLERGVDTLAANTDSITDMISLLGLERNAGA
jgi:hypothetical protein